LSLLPRVGGLLSDAGFSINPFVGILELRG